MKFHWESDIIDLCRWLLRCPVDMKSLVSSLLDKRLSPDVVIHHFGGKAMRGGVVPTDGEESSQDGRGGG
jgi:hypothetical protein